MVSLLTVGVAAMICGVAPMRQARSINPIETLAEGGRTATARPCCCATRATLQVVQTALAVVLLLSAGLVVRSFAALGSVDLGFEPGDTLTLTVEPRIDQRPANEWMRDLLARVSALPGVDAAGAVYLRPLALGPIGQGTFVTLEGQPETAEAARGNPLLNYQVATPGYFEAMRIRVVRAPLHCGRHGHIAARDDRQQRPRGCGPPGSIGAAPTSTFERGTGRTACAKSWASSATCATAAWASAVDMRDPASQTPMPATDLVLRTSVAPLSLLSAVERERARSTRVIISRIATLDAIVARTRAPWRFSAWMFSLFAALAFVLSTVGLAGLVALDVANRRHEFAIRSALGAAGRAIVNGVVRVALARAAAGVALGLALSVAATRGLRALLFGVTTSDWPTYGAVVAVVGMVTLVATWLPARRAATATPLALLRRE
jgi:hypothetical protein